MAAERVGVARRVAVHLRDRVEAVFSLDGHLPVALVAVGRRAQEVVHAQRTLQPAQLSLASLRGRLIEYQLRLG